jgi:hypothetical protein
MNTEEIKELLKSNPRLLLTDNDLMIKNRVDSNCVLVGYIDTSGSKSRDIDVLLGGNSPLDKHTELVYAFMVARNLKKVIVWGAGRVTFSTRDFAGWSDFFPYMPKPRLRRHLESLEGDAKVFALVGRDDNEMELDSVELDLEEVELILQKEK